MIFDLPMFTLIHVVISVVGIIAGLVVLGGLMAGARLDGWTALFLVTTTLTSITGFFFPASAVTPAHVVGALSLVVLAGVPRGALLDEARARLAHGIRRHRRRGHLPQRRSCSWCSSSRRRRRSPQLAPTQQETPFALTQAAVLGLFVWLGWAALRGFRGGP